MYAIQLVKFLKFAETRFSANMFVKINIYFKPQKFNKFHEKSTDLTNIKILEKKNTNMHPEVWSFKTQTAKIYKHEI